MSNPTGPALQTPRSDDVYRPLSSIAVVAFALAVVYVLLLGVFGILCLINRQPLFLSPWTLLIPAAAFALAVAAGQHLRYSEGTRSGEALVTWAKRLSIAGLLYLAVYVAIYVSVQQQASTYVENWFKLIKNDDLYEAFKETRKPEERAGLDRASMRVRFGTFGGRRGMLDMFFTSDLAHLLKNRDDVTVSSLGVRELDYDQGGYRVQLVYHISAPEGEYDWLVTARSTDARQGRMWNISLGEADTRLASKPRLTPLGMIFQQWRQNGQKFSHEVIGQRSSGDVVSFYLSSCTPAERTQLAKAAQERLARAVTLGVGNGQMNPFTLLQGIAIVNGEGMKGLKEFESGKLLSTQNLEESQDKRAEILRGARQLFQPGSDVRLRIGESHQTQFTPPFNGKPALFEQEFDLIVFERADIPPHMVEAKLVFETDATTAAPGDPPPKWRLVRVEVLRNKVVPSEKPRGPAAGPNG
jgi:hypothetical protein